MPIPGLIPDKQRKTPELCRGDSFPSQAASTLRPPPCRAGRTRGSKCAVGRPPGCALDTRSTPWSRWLLKADVTRRVPTSTYASLRAETGVFPQPTGYSSPRPGRSCSVPSPVLPFTSFHPTVQPPAPSPHSANTPEPGLQRKESGMPGETHLPGISTRTWL